MPELTPFRPLRRSFWTGQYARMLRSHGRVRGGPFAGMSYVQGSVGSQYWPKVFGTYECELWPLFFRLFDLHFRAVVDVGAAEGFYAVGCAAKWPNAEITAFESNPQGRELISQMARLNRVADRLQIAGECTPTALQASLNGAAERPTLCILDVEGAEQNLCDPMQVPSLEYCHLLVETHEFEVLGIRRQLRERFSQTHEIEEILPRARSLADFHDAVPLALRTLLGQSLVFLVDEWRHPGCTWMFMQPKARVIGRAGQSRAMEVSH